MKYTVQFIVSGYSYPEGTDIEYHTSIASIKSALLDVQEQAEIWGAGYEGSEATIYKGYTKNVTDLIPDKVAFIGIRGGVNVVRA
jgi:hypothetical protein